MSSKNNKVYWLSDSELESLVISAIEANVSLDAAIKKMADDQYIVDGKQVYVKKFAAAYHKMNRSVTVKHYFSA